MGLRFTQFRALMAVMVCYALSACSTLDSANQDYYSVPENSRYARQEALAEQYVQDKQPLSAAQVYVDIAASSNDPLVKQDYQLRAVEVLFDHQKPEAALNVLKQLPPGASSKTLLIRRQMVEAQAALFSNEPRRALSLLPHTEDVGDLPLRFKALSLRADALALLGDVEGALQIRTDIDAELDVPSKINNHKAIWALLKPVPEGGLNAMLTRARNRDVAGWIELALTYRFSRGRLEGNLAQWRANYPGHPASKGIAWQMAKGDDTFANHATRQDSIGALDTAQIALLLPMTGQYAPFAEAVRDGFTAALTAHARQSSAPPSMVRVYDIGDSGLDIQQAYDQAVADGATVTVGPLRKQAVAELLQNAALSVPLVTLNYLDDAQFTTHNAFQFGLNPEDEAKEAARYAMSKGYKRAAILYPSGDWGERMRRSFAETYTQLGGQVSSENSYPRRSNDFTNPLRGLLLANDSRTRHRRVEKLVKEDLKFENWIRDDVDVIFVPASARSGRLIQPQLAYFGVIKTPILSTSRIYADVGNVRLNRDLNGLLFNDTSWTLKAPSIPEEASLQMNALAESQSLQFMRLQALGADAFALLSELPKLQGNPAYRYSGFSGDLSLNASNRVMRHTPWGKFSNGRVRWVSDPATFNLDETLSDVETDESLQTE